ncbi:hypothetical protein NP570_23640, partial [Vibrio parahaemolyticus]|nr:hypothetical protein [Vibrio parahaemolyticus]
FFFCFFFLIIPISLHPPPSWPFVVPLFLIYFIQQSKTKIHTTPTTNPELARKAQKNPAHQNNAHN